MASSEDARPASFRQAGDLRVAAVAAVCTVGLTLVLHFGLGIDAPFTYRLAPLVPYFGYVFTRGAGLSERAWMALVAAVTAGTLAYLAL